MLMISYSLQYHETYAYPRKLLEEEHDTSDIWEAYATIACSSHTKNELNV